MGLCDEPTQVLEVTMDRARCSTLDKDVAERRRLDWSGQDSALTSVGYCLAQ